MDINDAIKRRRTIRQFKQEKVSKKNLIQLLEAARLAPCASNNQKIRFMVIESEDKVKDVFDQTAWGGHVKPRRQPQWGKTAPLTFILVTAPSDTGQLSAVDAGAAIQNMMLKATGMGHGCCWIGAFKADKVAEILELSRGTKPLFLLAVGVPAEAPLQEDIGKDGDTKYYLDKNNCLHVPKYTVDAVTTWV